MILQRIKIFLRLTIILLCLTITTACGSWAETFIASPPPLPTIGPVHGVGSLYEFVQFDLSATTNCAAVGVRAFLRP